MRFLLLLIAFVVAARAAAPVVANVRGAQRAGTELVDIYYDVTADVPPLTVSVQVSSDGGSTYAVPAVSFTGAVGAGVQPGSNRHIVWNAGADWDGQVSALVRFKVTAYDASTPSGMALIPAGSFEMGNSTNSTEGDSDELPVHTVFVSAFFMDRYEVTNDLMVEVMNWAYAQGKLSVTTATARNAQGNQQELLDLDDADCRITWSGSSFAMKALKGAGYPCVEVTWYGAAAFCNYRSEKEGLTPCYDLSDWSCNFAANGYRLPTEAEWEKAARGGLSGQRFPWGATITHSQANYYSSTSYAYDTSPTRGYHPTYAVDGYPYTSPVGAFAPNGYGLYDMAGNVWEWCGDWYSSSYYSTSPSSDPQGSPSGSYRVLRGGVWGSFAHYARAAYRHTSAPGGSSIGIGFRPVRR